MDNYGDLDPTWISKSRESKVIQNSPWFPPKSEVRTLKYVEFQSNDILTVPKVIYFNKFLYKKRQSSFPSSKL